LKESFADEIRVALVPESVKKLVAAGIKFLLKPARANQPAQPIPIMNKPERKFHLLKKNCCKKPMSCWQ